MPVYQKKFDKPDQRFKEVQRILFALYDNAYLAASVDSMVQHDTTMLTAYITHGGQYEWASLRKGNVDEGVLSQVGYSEKLFRHTVLYYKDALRLMDKVITFYENHGYPFAQIKLDSVKLNGNKLDASLSLQKKQNFLMN